MLRVFYLNWWGFLGCSWENRVCLILSNSLKPSNQTDWFFYIISTSFQEIRCFCVTFNHCVSVIVSTLLLRTAATSVLATLVTAPLLYVGLTVKKRLIGPVSKVTEWDDALLSPDVSVLLPKISTWSALSLWPFNSPSPCITQHRIESDCTCCK